MPEEMEKHGYETMCSASGCQNVSVSVPVSIKPYAKVGKVSVQCLGMPIISQNSKPCPHPGKRECRFTICRKLRIEVPVDFGAKAEVGEACIDCDSPSCEIYSE